MSVNDFIQTYLGVNQLLVQRQQLALANENARIARLQTIQGVAQNLYDRGAIPDLAQLAGDTAGGDLNSVLEATAPGAGITQRGLEGEGLAAATPEERHRLAEESITRGATGVGTFELNKEQFLDHLLKDYNPSVAMRGQLGQAFAAQTAAGMAPGQLALSTAIAGLPQGEISEGAGVQIGTRASAGDVLGAATQAAGIRAQETGQGLNYQLGLVNAKNDAARIAAGADAKMQDWRDPKFLMSQNVEILKELNQPNLPPGQVENWQRQLFANILAQQGMPLNPFPDIAPPREPGESDEAYRKKFEEAWSNFMTEYSGHPMNPRTVGGMITSWLQGGQ